jgi:pimeloyl-ACP methyl ester carboxylesterase
VIVVAGQVKGAATGCTEMAEYAARLLASLPERFILMGFSLGGLVALELIAQRPDRVAGLALVCAGVGAETGQGAAARRGDEAQAAAKGMATHAGEDLWPRFNAQGSHKRADYVAMAESLGVDLYRRQNDLAISRRDSSQRIAQIAVPVLLVTGAQDTLCPTARHDAILCEIPLATQAVVDGAGHLIAFDQPEVLAGILNGWVAGVMPDHLQDTLPCHEKA